MHDQLDQLSLMQDGALILRSRYPNNLRQPHRMKKMNYSPNSSNLNSTKKNLWMTLKELLRHHNKPKNKEEMKKSSKRYGLKYLNNNFKGSF